MKKLFLAGMLTLIPSLSWGEDNSARDAFVREVVVTLLQTQAAHVGVEETVNRAYQAWQKYQSLVEETEAGKKTGGAGE
jgi:hypothetical protein